MKMEKTIKPRISTAASRAILVKGFTAPVLSPARAETAYGARRQPTALPAIAHPRQLSYCQTTGHAACEDRFMATSVDALDQERVNEFALRIFGLYANGLLTYMIDLGHRTGLFTAAARGEATSAELAERASLQERYVREWLGAMVTGAIMTYDPATGRYQLPPEHAACLAGDSATNMAPRAGMVTHLGKHQAELERAFRVGGGVPYS